MLYWKYVALVRIECDEQRPQIQDGFRDLICSAQAITSDSAKPSFEIQTRKQNDDCGYCYRKEGGSPGEEKQ